MSSLIYIADPMCSWCYGFGPELSALLDGLPGLPLQIVVGGLRAYNTELLDEGLRSKVQGHWKQVAARSGLPFSDKALAHENFIYNTEPACRAAVAARMLAPQASLTVFHAIQRAFYADGQDVTQDEVLAAVAAAALTEAGVPTDAAGFLATFKSEAAVMATYQDFEQVKRWGVGGFPTLVLERDGKLELVTSGYMAMPALIEQLQAMVDAENGGANEGEAAPA